MKTIKIILALALILYVIIIVAVYFFQRKLIFYPGKLSKDFKFNHKKNGEELFLTTRDGETINALFYSGAKKEVILYFHGNAGDLSGWQFVMEDFNRIGYNILVIDYRGYGKSTGTITEKGFYEDAETAYQYLTTERQFLPENIIIYGRSIGSGVAVDLASKHAIKKLILEAPYSSLTRLTGEKVPWLFPAVYLKFRFDNLNKINSVKSPILFFHGSKDEVIPASHTNALYEKFNGSKKKIIIEGGNHNNLNNYLEYQEALLEFTMTHSPN